MIAPCQIRVSHRAQKRGRVVHLMFGLALATGLMLVPLQSRAQSAGSDEATARALFEQGMIASRTGDFASAARALEASYVLFAHPGTLLNLAVFQEAAGHRAAAYRSWSELLSRFNAVISADARQRARTRIAVLENELAAVQVTSQPEGATIVIDGNEVGTTPMSNPLRLEPGQHVFEARLEGHQDVRVVRMIGREGDNDIGLSLVQHTGGTPPTGDDQPTEAGAENGTPSGDESPVEATLTVESPTEGAMVIIDDGEPQPAPVSINVEQGEHRVGVEAAGFVPQSRTVEVGATGEVVVAIELDPESDGERGSGGGFWRSPWTWIVVGVLVAGAGLGIGLGVGLDGSDDPHHTLEMP